MSAPFSVHVHTDPPGRLSLVLGVSYPNLLVGPADGEASPRWVRPEECDLGRVYFDRPWHADFTAPAGAHEHEGDG